MSTTLCQDINHISKQYNEELTAYAMFTQVEENVLHPIF